eukprot:scaffold3271_cov181-Amphora_coffeaeformis.AAC.8
MQGRYIHGIEIFIVMDGSDTLVRGLVAVLDLCGWLCPPPLAPCDDERPGFIMKGPFLHRDYPIDGPKIDVHRTGRLRRNKWPARPPRWKRANEGRPGRSIYILQWEWPP